MEIKNTAFKIFFLASFTILLVGVGFLYYRVDLLEKNEARDDKTSKTAQFFQNETKKEVDRCGEACRKEIGRQIAQAIATISGQTETVIREVSTAEGGAGRNTVYIPLGSAYSTTNTDWVDVPDSAVYIDKEGDYGKDAKVTLEVSLKVAHANGKASARLYDDTNKIAVDFSEISTENNDTFKQVESANLPLWKGRNLYKVQIKSLNSFEVTISGARIKVSY